MGVVGNLSSDQLQFFHSHGFLVIESFVNSDEIDSMGKQMEQLLNGFDCSTSSIFSTVNQQRSTDDYFFQSAENVSFFFEEKAFGEDGNLKQSKELSINKVGHALHEIDPVFRRFSCSEKVSGLLSSLGYKRPIAIQSMYIFKQPGIGGEVVPHQDNSFLYTEPTTCTGLWLALEDANTMNGCLWAIPGSHKNGLVRRFLRGNKGVSFDQPSPAYDQKDFTPIEVKAGSLVVIHGDLIHQSFENQSPKSRLQVLSLENNEFIGDLPMELFEIHMLQRINISANKITGGIPNSIILSTSLTSIDLSQNRLTGQIPKGISKLKILSVFNVSGNQITGPIPTEIRSMMSLTTLDFSYNNFLGKIPIGGQFSVFNYTAFTGNPNLCFANHNPCPYLMNSNQALDNPHKKLNSTNLMIPIVSIFTILSCILITVYIRKKNKHQKSMAWKLTAFQRLDFKAEDVLTCLKDDNIIGKGGAGVVYRGSMPDGSDVAIKLLLGSGRNDHGFSAEIQTLGRIRHRNIVRLLGYVSNKERNLLLYEYMGNGSLDERLHGVKGGQLGWDLRYKIAVEAARGLCYLHHDCTPLIIHRDVKSNNILLDHYFEAHVSDFGLAKFLQNSGASECMSSIAGSYGYIAPEYAYTLKVDEKSDVYSFGVVLLELIAGRKPVGDFGDGVDIVRWVMKTTSELSQPSDAASVLAVVDSRLSQYPLQSVIHLFKIAMMCVEEESSARPTMREVVHMLTNPPRSAPPVINL